MGQNILINLKWTSVESVFANFDYYSKNPRLLLPDPGDYAVFLSFNPSTRRHLFVGYFVVQNKHTEPNDALRASEWGRYVLEGNPATSSRTVGIDILDVFDALSLWRDARSESLTPSAIGQSTQQIRELSDEDVRVILRHSSVRKN